MQDLLKPLCDLPACDIVRGKTTVLSNVSLTVNRGDCVILNGANGRGKSSLLRYLVGLTGHDCLNTHKVGYVGHTLALKDGMTVAESLNFFSMLNGHTNVTEGGLSYFGCNIFKDRKIKHCSAGQKQRTALTRLLLEDVDMWCLDEPTTALDKTGVQAFEKLVATLREQGVAFVIATHTDLAVAPTQIIDLNQLS